MRRLEMLNRREFIDDLAAFLDNRKTAQMTETLEERMYFLSFHDWYWVANPEFTMHVVRQKVRNSNCEWRNEN